MYKARYIDGVVVTPDPDHQDCPDCKQPVEQLYSLTTMRPDTHWSGVYFDTTDYYSTSKSRYNKYMKDNGLVEIGDRTDREGLTKWAKESEKDKEKKREKLLDQFLIEELAGVDLDQSDGQSHVVSREQRNKEEKKRNMESAHPEDVFIDPAFL